VFYENDDKDAAGRMLAKLADELHALEQRTGKLIHVCIEPEPGCLIDTAFGFVSFYEDRVLPHGNEDRIRRHLRVCHDVCHSAVMFEPQEQAIETYREAGIVIGKVQLSSAVRAVFDENDVEQRHSVFEALKAFDEPRYMHQTVVETPSSFGRQMFADLPEMIETEAEVIEDDDEAVREARVHFHVPLFVEQFGPLDSTQPAVLACLDTLCGSEVRHYEVETYAWDVLPAAMQVERLSDGIAEELQWVRDVAAALGQDA